MRAFQKDLGLQRDGVIKPDGETWDALHASLDDTRTADTVRATARALQDLGRGGDTILAHITPAEAAVLKAHGGSGTTNPDTGLMEFWRSSRFAPKAVRARHEKERLRETSTQRANEGRQRSGDLDAARGRTLGYNDFNPGGLHGDKNRDGTAKGRAALAVHRRAVARKAEEERRRQAQEQARQEQQARERRRDDLERRRERHVTPDRENRRKRADQFDTPRLDATRLDATRGRTLGDTDFLNGGQYGPPQNENPDLDAAAKPDAPARRAQRVRAQSPAPSSQGAKTAMLRGQFQKLRTKIAAKNNTKSQQAANARKLHDLNDKLAAAQAKAVQADAQTSLVQTTSMRFELPSAPTLVNAMHAPKPPKQSRQPQQPQQKQKTPERTTARTVSSAMKALEDKINVRIAANRQRVKNYLAEADTMKTAGHKMTPENRALAQARSRRKIAEQNASFGETFKHEGYKAAAQIGDWLGLDKASIYLQHFLEGHGEDIVLSRDVAMQSGFVRKAEAENLARTETMTLTGTTSDATVNANMLGLKNGQSTHFSDYWDAPISGTETSNRGWDHALAYGGRNVLSEPTFHAIRKGDTFYVSGTVEHDAGDKYDINEDSPFEDMKELQAKGLGVPFETKSEWSHTFVGTVEVLGQDKNGNNILGNLKITWNLKQ